MNRPTGLLKKPKLYQDGYHYSRRHNPQDYFCKSPKDGMLSSATIHTRVRGV